jgi:hypothetical protein
MAITGTGNDLGDAIWAAIKASTGMSPSGAADIAGRNVWRALATSMISHLVTNTVVSVSVTTTGTASAQSGGGSGTIS